MTKYTSIRRYSPGLNPSTWEREEHGEGEERECEDRRPHAWSMYKTSEFPTTSDFPTELPTHKEGGREGEGDRDAERDRSIDI